MKQLLLIIVLMTGCRFESLYECHTVEEVLKCGEDECRVVLETGERVTAFFITVSGDRVAQNKEFRNVELRNRMCPQE